MDLKNLTQHEVSNCLFQKYGTKEEVLPKFAESCEENPWGKSSICWRWVQIMDTGVDIVIQLREEYDIDHVTVKFAQGKAPARAMVLSEQKAVCEAQAGEQLKFVIAEKCRELTVRLYGNMQDIEVERLQIGACVEEGLGVYPIPRHTKVMQGCVLCTNLGAVKYEAEDEGQKLAARMLTEKVREYLGQELTGNVPILLRYKQDMEMESYKLQVTETQVVITAGERKGFLYGVSSLLQMMRKREIKCCEIEDRPWKEFRGFHMGLPPREEIGFYKRLIRDLLVPMRYNTLFLQITAGMRLHRHPEINDAWIEACRKSASGEWPPLPHSDMIAGGQVLEQEEVAELVAYARTYGLEVIPEIQSLGHVQYITMAHPELAETALEEQDEVVEDQRLADQPPATFYKHCYCPSNEESYKLLFDIIDEIVDVLKPSRYVHMGHDEVYQIGICPKCRNSSPAELFASDVRKIHSYLRQKGLGMMIWSDMIQSCSEYETKEAVDMLPKDIVMLDFIWYFHMEKDLEDNLLAKGYSVAVGNLYSSHYRRFESRIRKANMLGGEVSTWCRPDEYVLGREGKLYDLLYTANMLWSEQYDSAYRATYTGVIAGLLPWIRSGLHGRGLYPSLKEGMQESALLLKEGKKTAGSEQLQLDFADRGFRKGCFIDCDNRAEYEGEGKAWESLVFYHASPLHEGRKPFGPMKKVGRYVVEYTDGSSEDIDVEYGGNIGCIDNRYAQPAGQAYFRHAGYTATYFTDPVETKAADGKLQTLYRLEWLNEKRKPIRRICCFCEDGSGILMAGASGICPV